MLKYIYRLLIIIVLIQIHNCSFSQNTLLLNSAQPKNFNSSRFILNRLQYFDSIREEDSLNYYILKGREFCKNLDLSNIRNNSHSNYGGDIYMFLAQKLYKKNQYSEALSIYNKALNIFEITNNKVKIASCLKSKGDVFQQIGNQNEALNNYYKSNTISRELKDSINIALTSVKIAKIYKDQGDYKKAQGTLDKALNIVNGIGNPAILCQIKNSIATLKVELGETEAALSLLQEALSLSKTSNNDNLRAKILNNIGSVYIEKGELENAKDFYTRALDVSSKNKNYEEGAISMNNLGKYYFYINRYDKAIQFASKSLALGKEINNETIRTKAINLLLNIYEKEKDWEKAYYYQNLLLEQLEKKKKNAVEQVLLQEKVRLDKEKDRFIARKKEVEDTLVVEKRSRQRAVFFIGGGIFFILMITIVLIIYLRLRATREKNKYITKQSEERKLLLQEVHHRVKNNFQIVSSMLRLQSYNFKGEELQSSFEEAINRINAMAIVHEIIYQQEEFRDINANSYLKNLIELLKKTGQFQVAFSIQSENFPLKIETLISLGIILNELITNSFKHAFNSSIIEPKINIVLNKLSDKSYELIYQDNGIGMSKNLTSNFGMDLIDTIISNYDGSVKLFNDSDWPTSIKILFSEF